MTIEEKVREILVTTLNGVAWEEYGLDRKIAALVESERKAGYEEAVGQYRDVASKSFDDGYEQGAKAVHGTMLSAYLNQGSFNAIDIDQALAAVIGKEGVAE